MVASSGALGHRAALNLSATRQFRISVLQSGMRIASLLCLALVVSTALAAKPEGKGGKGGGKGAGRSNAKGAPKMDEMDVERWAELREAERYQLNIAEKYFKAQNWKLALDEYEKFLSLYEKTNAASFAQLKWAMCQVNLRKLNTAIKDGYQSVIDYWPDSPEAVAAAFLIAHTYKSTGEVQQAKKAYATVIETHPDELVAALSRRDLIEIARVEGDTETMLTQLKHLTFETPRKGDFARICIDATHQLASIQFYGGSYDEGIKTLETTYKEPELTNQLTTMLPGPIQSMLQKPDKKAAGEKIAETLMARLKSQIPTDLTEQAAKDRAKHKHLQIVGVLSILPNTGDQIGRIYDLIMRTCGVTDDMLMRKAGWLKGRSQRDDARATYGQMKDQIEGQWQICSSYLEENNYKKALELLEDLIKKDGDHAQRWRLQIAEIYVKTQKYREAIAVYRQCDNPPSNWQAMASCHRALKEYDEALLLYQQIVTSFPPSAPWARTQMGYTFEQAGRKEAAIQTFQQVCKLYPKASQASEAHAHLQNKYKISVTLGGSKDE